MSAAVPYVLPLFCGAVLAAHLAMAAWRRRAMAGATLYAALLALVTFWSATEAFEILATSFADKVLIDRLQYIAVEFTPILWMLLGVTMSRRARWFRRWGWIPATLFGLFSAAIVISGDQLGLVWSRVWLDESAPVPMLRVEHGPWFYANITAIYALFVAGGALMVDHSRSFVDRRSSAVLTVFGVSLGLIGGLVNAAGFAPFGIADPTVYGVTFGGIAIAVGHFRYNLLDSVFGVLPVAHEMVVAGLDDGVLIVGSSGRVLYANPSARRILDLGQESLDGTPMDRLVLEALGLAGDGDEAHGGRRDVVLSGESGLAHYDLRVTSLVRSRVSVGRLLVLHDITERKQREAHLEHLADHDPLTGAANRRALDAALESALRRAALGEPGVLLYADADGFKAVNDALGHAAGDQVLALLAQRISHQLRAGDLFARVGGDEFAALLSDVDTSRAFAVAERIRREVGASPFVVGSHGFRITLSVGLAGLGGQPSPAAAIGAADAALYLAKNRGRDRVVVADVEIVGTAVT